MSRVALKTASRTSPKLIICYYNKLKLTFRRRAVLPYFIQIESLLRAVMCENTHTYFKDDIIYVSGRCDRCFPLSGPSSFASQPE